MKDSLKELKPWQAFKTFAILFSFVVNFIFVIVLLLAVPLLLPIVKDAVSPLVQGLDQSFVEMNEASIIRTISVSDFIPIDFIVPLDTDSVVILTEDVTLQDYPITMNMSSLVMQGGGGYVNGTVTLVLPAGLPLPVALNLDVPVQNEVPVNLDVAIDIPLNETELNTPFTRLHHLFGPLVDQLDRIPDDLGGMVR